MVLYSESCLFQDESDTKHYHMIACACVRSITERSLILSRRYLLDKIMEPFLKMTVGGRVPEDGEEELTVRKKKCSVFYSMSFSNTCLVSRNRAWMRRRWNLASSFCTKSSCWALILQPRSWSTWSRSCWSCSSCIAPSPTASAISKVPSRIS